MLIEKKFTKRPRSLREVSLEALAGRNYASSMKEFLDEVILVAEAPDTRYGFYQIPRTYIEDAPAHLDNKMQMVHLAGSAENLALLAGLQPPEWTEEDIYFLKEPIFFGGPHSREHIITETPSAFRRRLLFCGPSLNKLILMRPRP
jgi:hypothetical protein